MKIKTILLSLVVISITALTGCQHTASGFGQDMQSNGKSIQRTVN